MLCQSLERSHHRRRPRKERLYGPLQVAFHPWRRGIFRLRALRCCPQHWGYDEDGGIGLRWFFLAARSRQVQPLFGSGLGKRPQRVGQLPPPKGGGL